MGRIYDIVVRLTRRRGKPSTPLPPKRQLPIAEYVYCYDPLDDDGTAGAGWHWEPRKPYFDRSAEAIFEHDAPMSSAASLHNSLHSSRPSSSASEPTRPRRSPASGTMPASSGAPALYSGDFESAQDISVHERVVLPHLAFASPFPPDNSAEKGYKATTPDAAFNTLNFTSTLTNDNDIPKYAMSSAASEHSAEHHSPPRAGPSRDPARPRTTQPKSILKKPKSPATTDRSAASSNPGVRAERYIPPIIPSPPPMMPIVPSPPSPGFTPFIPPLPSPPLLQGSPHLRRHTLPDRPYLRSHAPRRQPTPPVIPPRVGSWSPPARAVHPLVQQLPRHKRVRDFPAGYYGGISHLFSPGELVFSFLHPNALHRRLLDGSNRVPVALHGAELHVSAFYPHTNQALFLVPQLPWAIVLRADPMVTVGQVLGGLRDHLGQRLTRAEREMVRERERGRRDLRDVRLRGEVLGVENSWLLGMWEDADAVRHFLRAMTGLGGREIAQGRRCFIVAFGSEEEARALSGD